MRYIQLTAFYPKFNFNDLFSYNALMMKIPGIVLTRGAPGI